MFYEKKGKKKLENQYYIHTNQASNQPTYKYLGVILSHDFSWNANVDDVIPRESRPLNFIQRNLKCSETA